MRDCNAGDELRFMKQRKVVTMADFINIHQEYACRVRNTGIKKRGDAVYQLFHIIKSIVWCTMCSLFSSLSVSSIKLL